jgi:hypothetical protein
MTPSETREREAWIRALDTLIAFCAGLDNAAEKRPPSRTHVKRRKLRMPPLRKAA